MNRYPPCDLCFADVFRSDSRIPEASLGTAEEDALRRDFTLNALFYNVNEGKVEDKTGRYDRKKWRSP